MKTRCGLAVMALALTSACAGTVMTPSRHAASQASVRGAEEVDADTEPRAALHLKFARDQLAAAEALSEKGEGEEADRMLARAEVDADLAIALAKQGSAERSAKLVMSEVQEAKQEVRK